ncbi:MAG: COX15/CtaA family protein [Verrucomicrobia bacterium]|nr:COX15/CtaA family protein [Verrucomicrobiota bacterium]
MRSELVSAQHPSLHRFAVLTAIATLGLVGVGGLVTSHGAGMAVPDWPNTYGYNMFFFPISQWVGGIFYEHTHRLVASGVGLLTVVLALWLHGWRARPVMRWWGLILLLLGAGTALAAPRRLADGSVAGLVGLVSFGASWVWPRCEPSAKWLRWCGVAALVAVILQGVLGGLRVVLFKDVLGIFHATLAQLFFVLVCAIVLFTSRWWQTSRLAWTTAKRDWDGVRPSSGAGGYARNEITGLSNVVGGSGPAAPGDGRTPVAQSRAPGRASFAINYQLSALFTLTTLLILGQLALGAAMRHQHAGLAIPDFPLAYGRLWPAMDAASVEHYNAQRIEIAAANPIAAFQIGLQMIHRLLAVSILAAVAFAAWSTRRALGGRNLLSRMALVWLGLILTQALLGAATIWSNKAADVATAHVLVGALSLAMGAMLSLIAARELAFSRRTADSPAVAEAFPLSPLQPQPSAIGGLH